MRIELNAGGLSGLFSIAEFDLSVNALENDIEKMISSFQTVKKSVYDLNGGVGKLDGALTLLQNRINIEEKKKSNLQDLRRNFGDFVDLAVSIDKRVAQDVLQNREAFYKVNEHLRPVITVDSEFLMGIEIIGDALYETVNAILDPIKKAEEFIVDFIIEYGDEILAVVVTVVLVIGGIVLTIATFGTAWVILGVAVLGAGIGWGIASWKSMQDDGDVDLLESLKGGCCGFIAGAAIGASIYFSGALATASSKSLGSFLWTKFATGAGRAMGMDFFMQTVVESDNVGFDNYDIGETLYAGVKSGLVDMAIGGIFQYSGLDKFITGKFKGIHPAFTNKPNRFLIMISKTPASFLSNTMEVSTERIIDLATGNAEGKFYFWENIALGVVFDVWGDTSAEIREKKAMRENILSNIEASKAARESSNFGEFDKMAGDIGTKAAMKDRVLSNIEASKAARESSNFGEFDKMANDIAAKKTMKDSVLSNSNLSKSIDGADDLVKGSLNYGEYKISSKGLRRLLGNRGLTADQIESTITSFEKYAHFGTPGTGLEGYVTVKHSSLDGDIKWVYSGRGDASGIFTSSDIYIDNATGIDALATPNSNDMLQAEKVLVFGDQINGKVAAQPSFAADASKSSRDNISRSGGGMQTVTNGGFASNAVKHTGEFRRLFDTAGRQKLLSSGSIGNQTLLPSGS